MELHHCLWISQQTFGYGVIPLPLVFHSIVQLYMYNFSKQLRTNFKEKLHHHFIQQRHTELNEGTTFRDPSQLSTKQLASRNDFIDVTTVITDYVNINAQPRPPQTRNNGKQ